MRYCTYSKYTSPWSKLPLENLKVDVINSNQAQYALFKLQEYEIVINFLIKNNVIILGGDLVEVNNNIQNYTGTNWYYNPSLLLTVDQNIQNSVKEFKIFLQNCEEYNYGGLNKNNIYINFVIKHNIQINQ